MVFFHMETSTWAQSGDQFNCPQDWVWDKKKSEVGVGNEVVGEGHEGGGAGVDVK